MPRVKQARLSRGGHDFRDAALGRTNRKFRQLAGSEPARLHIERGRNLAAAMAGFEAYQRDAKASHGMAQGNEFLAQLRLETQLRQQAPTGLRMAFAVAERRVRK